MAAMPSSRALRPCLNSTTPYAVWSLWAPVIQSTHKSGIAQFSTSPALRKKDNNKNRGLSVMRGTGLRPRQTLSVKQKDFANQQLPTPVQIETTVNGTRDHGLWDFFKDQRLLQTPVEIQQHGRAWTVGELRSRDWESLHQLWWVCVKDRNNLATEKIERKRLEAGYGDYESNERDKTVQQTMKAILDTLAERHQAYQEALELAKHDPDINLSRMDGPQYTQPPYDPLEADDAPYDTQPELVTEEPVKDKALPMDEKPKEKTSYA